MNPTVNESCLPCKPYKNIFLYIGVNYHISRIKTGLMKRWKKVFRKHISHYFPYFISCNNTFNTQPTCKFGSYGRFAYTGRSSNENRNRLINLGDFVADPVSALFDFKAPVM